MTWCRRFVAAAKMVAERSELRSRLNAGCAEVIPGLLESIRKATSERWEYGKGKKSARGSSARGASVSTGLQI